MLNDDTHLFEDALSKLVKSSSEAVIKDSKKAIVIGSTTDESRNKTTYGGVIKRKNYIGFRFDLVDPKSSELRQCDSFNANCVLVPMEVVRAIGILAEEFSHGLGDYDYGLRANKAGFNCYVVPGHIGLCARHTSVMGAFDDSNSLEDRKKILKSSKGLPPNEWLLFLKKHASIWIWLLMWLQLKIRVYFPRAWQILRRIRGRER